MAARIAVHRAARPADWRTVEAPLGVGNALRAAASGGEAVIVDCLTLLVSNCLLALAAGGDLDAVPTEALQARVDGELDGLLGVVAERRLAAVVVSNEVGLGVVPAVPSARHYADVLGRANQRLATAAERVWLMVA